MSELKLCPMCGNKQPQIDSFGVTIRASCYDCGIQTPNYHIDDVERDYVIDNWNQRVGTETEKSPTTDRNNAISLMSPSWKHSASKEPDLMTHYVTMAENQFKKKSEEIKRLTEIATKHATRADELYEALERVCSYLSEDGLINTGLAKEIVNAQRVLNKSQINTVSDYNYD